MKIVIEVSDNYYRACKEKAKIEIGTCTMIAKGEPLDNVLDKIRAEIVDLGQRTMNDNRASGIWACRDIIDKCKGGSEGTK